MDKNKRQEKFGDYDETLKKISLALFEIVSPKEEQADVEKYEHVVISIAALTAVVDEVLRRFGDMSIISESASERLRTGVAMLDRSIGLALVEQAVSGGKLSPTTLADLDEKTATKN